MESSRLVRGVFVLLVVATVAAFYVTQELKQEVPLVLRFAVGPDAFSPNGDRVRDTATLGFDLSETANVTFAVIDVEGREVRRLVDDRRLPGDKRYRYKWDGRDDDGVRVPDGTYRMRFVRRREGRSIDSFKEVRVDTVRPRVRIASAEPGVLDPDDPDQDGVAVSYDGPSNGSPEFRVFRTDGGPVRIVRRFRGNTRSGRWDGSVISGREAVDGDYAFQVRVRDAAGNQTIAPRRRPSARNTRAGAGVSVRRLTLDGPLDVVGAGAVAQLRVGPEERRFRFVLSRLGSAKPVRQGVRRGGALRVGLPDDARTGVYVVRVRSRGHSAVWPLAVAGLPPRRARSAARPLVVLPALTWQGRNRYDSDLDGFPDTLENSDAIPIQRPFAGGAMPERFASDVAPLLRFLDRERLPYDLTTDLSLARGKGPSPANAPGVVIASTAQWLPRSIRDRLQDGVREDGLSVLSFGDRSLRRQVAVAGDELRDPSPARPDDLFGERTRTFSSDPPAPLGVADDRLGLFGGIDGLFGEFSRFERSLRLPAGARLLSSAGREPGQPAFVAYRLGKGTVIRPGTPQWARQLRESSLSTEVPRVMIRTWRLLSRGRPAR